jgi:hypothetical protein
MAKTLGLNKTARCRDILQNVKQRDDRALIGGGNTMQPGATQSFSKTPVSLEEKIGERVEGDQIATVIRSGFETTSNPAVFL